MRYYVEDIIAEGFPLNNLLSQIHDFIVSKNDIKDTDKALICEKLALVYIIMII